MKTIDRYVGRNFLFSYLVVLVGFLGLAVIIDASMNLDEFMELLDPEEPALARTGRLLRLMGSWYLVQVSLFFQMLMPIITVVAAVVTVVMLKRRNEFVPLLASGVSVYRVLWPVVFLALLASGLGVANQEALLPRLAGRLVRKADDPEGHKPRTLDTAFTDADDNRISATQYIPFEQRMKKVFIDGPTLHVFAENAVWDDEAGVWRLTDGWIQETGPDGTPRPREPFGDDPGFTFETSLRPQDVDRPTEWIRLSSVSDLVERIEDRPDQPRLRVELHSRYVVPLSAVTLLLLGLPLVLMQESKSVIVGLGIALVICLTYLGVQFVCQQLGATGRVAPILSVWLPIFIFGPVAILLFDSMRT